ncbi:hypothetical protein LCD36_04755 [Saccharopolyspora sp. 6T]|uniref:hypothetical protein n=1 Tax=Saccharopolyspora sp. 6T TaxID=2877238 RepID=UPI001CD3FBB6|nr:hypothetical protein [Saccharopolyspora sp. 6T]MCA1185762.1 hypothetical protein [Saccharopolyspora sp. 6T]
MAEVLKFPARPDDASEQPVVREYQTVGELFGGLVRELEEGRHHVALTWARDCAEAWAHLPLPDDEEDEG